MFTLPFVYNGKKYAALVDETFLNVGKEYRLTIMNGELEALLYGNHILVEKDNKICCYNSPKEENEQLVLQLINSLNDYLISSAVF
jgi:hypothetical protein